MVQRQNGKTQNMQPLRKSSERPDGNLGKTMSVPVHQGDCHVTSDPQTVYSTILGSCVSACVRDVRAGVGGMNHFLLAEPSASSGRGESARYGAFAMESLINKVLTAGTGDKANLEIKVFGGGNIKKGFNAIGSQNASFVKKFLRDEGYHAKSEDLGGEVARKVIFEPTTGRVFVKQLASDENDKLYDKEVGLAKVKTKAPSDDIELF